MIESWMIIGGVTFSVAMGTLFFKLRDINWASNFKDRIGCFLSLLFRSFGR